MKVLKFKNQTEISFADTSTILDCVSVLSSFSQVDAITDEFTEENLVGATFDGERVENIVPVSASASIENGKVVLHVINKVKTEDNIQREEIEELQGAIAELAEMIAELNITVASLTESDNEEEGE